MRLDIKPLSVNEAWQGRRVKTKKYRDFETNQGEGFAAKHVYVNKILC